MRLQPAAPAATIEATSDVDAPGLTGPASLSLDAVRDTEESAMRTMRQWAMGGALVLTGYVLGVCQTSTTRELTAQEPAATQGPSDDTAAQIKAAYDALSVAQQSLETEGLYKPAVNGLNSFSTLSGGVDAVGDLNSGRGVDPETFAALYAGFGNQEVLNDLGKDPEGRMTYKGKVIRMYPIARIQSQLNKRDALAGKDKKKSK